jgi:predicted ATPase
MCAVTSNEILDSGFIGRLDEMAALTAVLDEVMLGRGQMAMLTGEPGIGKTRLAQELANHAESKGALVLWGRCYEEQGVPPYWPWVQAIRSLVRQSDTEQLRSEIGAGVADIAGLVPEVKERLPEVGPPSQMESPEQTQFRMFDSVATFLKNASQKQPLVVVLDDLHWADLPSLQLLRFVTRELDGARLMLLGTYRDVELNRQHPLVETLGELT